MNLEMFTEGFFTLYSNITVSVYGNVIVSTKYSAVMVSAYRNISTVIS